jgi:U1 small nuclear ribonucleoprotein
MTQFLPPNLLALFAPRDPIPFLQPPDKLPHEKKNVHNYHGVAGFVEGNFEDPVDTPPPTRVETRDERIERKRREKDEQETYKLEQKIALWDPQSNPEGTTDPFRTLFVSRINFYTSESKLRREFESYGPIKQIKLINDQKTGKPRGYCFIEFEQEKDMHCKYFFSIFMLLLLTEVLKMSSGELYFYSVSRLDFLPIKSNADCKFNF